MPNFDRTLWRTASRVVAALEAERRQVLTITLPNSSWSQLQALTQQLDCTGRHGWTAAAQAVRQSLHLQLRWLATDLQTLAAATNDPTGDLEPRAGDVYEDLRALQTRFDQVAIDLRATTISVTTEPVTLDDVYLGPFRLVWNWSRLDQDDALRVIAEDPHPPESQEDVTHPHVRDEALCEGDARQSLRLAIRSGRLLDYFEIVERVLSTYNRDSAYVSLAEWDCSRCQGCDDAVGSDEVSCCEDCDDQFCADCQTACATCGCVICRSCAIPCVQCEESLCRRCRSTRLGPPTCNACFNQESTHENEKPSTVAAAEANDGLAVHPDRLGQAVISAGCG